MTIIEEPATSTDTAVSSDRYMIVSTDSHAGPRVKDHLRAYCPEQHLAAYDEFVAAWEPLARPTWDPDGPFAGAFPFTDALRERTAEITATDGVFDAATRIADMDADGIAAEVIYHGAMTPDVIPWGDSPDAGLRTLGVQIYNRWLADFCAEAPHRFIGAAHLPMWDIDASVAEVRWAAEHGLKCINFPAPNRAFPAYNEPVWEPFWQAIVDTGLPLTTHGGSGDMPAYSGREKWALYMSDLFYFSRRALHYLVWGGVFERHPSLKLIFTEQRSEWVPSTLDHLDSIYASEFHDWKTVLPRKPSEYFRQNCWIASSFMARFEAEARHTTGVTRLMWGTDYPHYEGSYGNTQECLRATFSGLPVDEVRLILGENAIECFNLDRDAVRAIADRIGPFPADVDRPLDPSDEPTVKGCAFRKLSTWG
ncbi:MAG TPA: amidohydrolase family protein [Ilumatobacter sp.]|nr:amidohydrolase family protein [Ilumatobacter sp.]